MRQKNHKLKAVIFDMDGVITNTMPEHYRAWRTVLKEKGVDVSHHDIYSREGQRGITSVYELFLKYRVPYTERAAKDVLKKKESLFKKIVKTRFIVGARSFIRSLYNGNIKLALVTGTSRHELHKILPEKLYNYFDVVVTGSDVKNGKPDPEPYRKALNQLKIRADEAVAIENAPFGIRSARKAGLKCYALETSLPKDYLKEAHAVFPSIKELRRKTDFILN